MMWIWLLVKQLMTLSMRGKTNMILNHNRINMITITLELYNFDELSQEVQKEIIERERWNIMEQCMEAYGMDYVTSLRVFEKLTNTTSCNWSVNYSGYSFDFKYSNNPIFECPVNCDNDLYPEDLCGKLLFRYINNNIIPYITQGKYYSILDKYIDRKYTYKHRRSHIIKYVGDDCPLTGMCYDYYLLEPIIEYYKNWCSYPDDFSLTDLIEQCYESFFKCWHKEYRYWANNENVIRGKLHNDKYKDRLYYVDGRIYKNGELAKELTANKI